MKHKGEIVITALDLYFKKVSLRQVQDHIKQIHGDKVSHVTILKWIRKYSLIYREFTKQLKVNGSDTLHADEMMVKVNGEWVWLWNVMDKRTKFITSSHLSEDRNLIDAVKIFKESDEKLVDKPKQVVTDGLPSYPRAIRKVFWRHPQTKHTRCISITEKVNNNPIERYHGTVRDVIRSNRGFHSFDSTQAIMGGFTNYYNFIRPHSSLGMTPAEAAGISLPFMGDNRLMEFTRMAVESQSNGHTLANPKLTDFVKTIKRTKGNKSQYIVRVFDGGKELDNPKKTCGMETRFSRHELAVKSAKFYKAVYPKYDYKIEGEFNNIGTTQSNSL